MPLKLMYITNRPEIALLAEKYGVDRIFVDMEYIGKDLRQGGMDSVQNHHTVADVARVRRALTKAELLVRVNPIHEATEAYDSSESEIDAVIDAGADIVMLPYFKTVREVERFLKAVDGRRKTMLLLETPEAVEALDEILQLPGIDEIHIGINDLSLGYGRKFMFELLADGTVERICRKLKVADVFYGFGGIASLGRGLVPAEMIIREHYRLDSRMVILSRSFCNADHYGTLEEIEEVFRSGLREIRALEDECLRHKLSGHTEYFSDNRKKLVEAVVKVTGGTA